MSAPQVKVPQMNTIQAINRALDEAMGLDPSVNRESTAVMLADLGGFWVVVRRKEMPYGSIGS